MFGIEYESLNGDGTSTWHPLTNWPTDHSAKTFDNQADADAYADRMNKEFRNTRHRVCEVSPTTT